MRGENEFGPDISNEDLTVGDIPPSDAPYWQGIDIFALTFDGYAALGDRRCGDLANSAAARFEATGDLPETLTELRTGLFFEQRRWRHFAEHPDRHTMRNIRALLEAIRAEVEAGDLT